ncbi:phosphatidate cytidylyltransferase [Oxobacter pfennigii]|uniref:Phosphatidate cytidylyltransferase n=1 Tax=Oxobacter pfennigii TaxID=36849 RepID=A0A0N8NT58_9CLOT|nr:phosphatidate cytidylyltransferase [Oxobacter pfennigii]KPU43912.1 phosphatidate cytidylyltransferase [Oxobacter pfennigii]
MLLKRILSAVIALPILFAAVLINVNIFFVALLIVTGIALYEYFNAVCSSNIKPMKVIGISGGLVMVLLLYNSQTRVFAVPYITILTLILLSIPVFSKKYNFWGAGATIVGILYISLFFGYLYLIRAIQGIGVYLIWFVFICSWVTDTSAYFSGMFFGKNKLAPDISPKKTIEGAIGGVVGSCIVCVLYGVFLNMQNIIDIPIFSIIIMGIIGSIISQIGDLAASAIKRNVGIKDYGHIMPGHGGVLDRFDSILFLAPVIYYYIRYVFY